ncbi:MAG: AI-2E family transporter [Romboutsia sp.]|uniref:AI-2E family transporter n=1 Tax=Romboutsia sp. TaxID=1965302 RepID=UPI003F2CA90C
MKRIKDEMLKSLRYIIPLILIFLGVLILKNYSNILDFISTNVIIISEVLTPFIIGFAIAYILNQPMKFLEKKYSLKRGLSITIIYGTVVIVMVFIWLFIVPIITSNVNEIYTYIPEGITQIENLINNMSSEFKINIQNPEVQNQINEFIKNILIPLSTSTATLISEILINLMSIVVSYTVNIFLGIVISVYLLLSKECTIEIVSILSERLFGRFYLRVKEFINVLDRNIGVYIVAKFIDSTIYGTLCTIVLALVGSKYALFLGVIMGVTNMIPFFGPIIGTIVVTIINLFFSFKTSVIVLVAMIIVQQLESAVLEPYFVGKQVGVPPIFTILSVTLAGKYAGFVGILLAVPVTGVLLMYATRYIEREKLNKIKD